MAGIDLLALIVYMSPLVGSPERRQQEIRELQSELNAKTREVLPLEDLPKKIQVANREIADFYRDRIPEQQSQIAAELGKLTAANGVRIEAVKYGREEARTGGLESMEIDADLAGNYTSLAKFINALERDKMFFIISSVTLSGQPQGQVKLTIKLEAYLNALSQSN